MMKERLAQLLARKLSREATIEELNELEALLKTNPGDQYFADMLLEYWQNPTPGRQFPQNNADKQFAHILELAEDKEESAPVSLYPQPRRTGKIARLIAVAACLAGLIFFSIWFFDKKNAEHIAKGDSSRSEVIAKKGFRSKILLPDGSQVWLNSESSLQYEQAFNDSLREVTLDGEAFFDVVKNPERPFIVHTSSIDIKVLGTAFNVKSYATEKTIETTLIHGSVEVTKKNETGQSKIILKPKQKLVYNRLESDFEEDNDGSTKTDTKNNVSAIAIVTLPKEIADTALKETSWIYNRLDFEGDTFGELAVKMERWYNVTITFKNPAVASLRLRGSFENETLDEALEALQLIATFTYKKTENGIEISK